MEVKHYHSSSGRDLIESFLIKCPQIIRENYFEAVLELKSGKKLTMPISKPLFNICIGLHELRFKDKQGIFRFFYYIKRADSIYVIHAYKKKDQAIPKKEEELVLKRLREI